MDHRNINKCEDACCFYIDYEDGDSLYILIIRDEELVFMDEDGIHLWFTEKSMAGVQEFIDSRNDWLGEENVGYTVTDWNKEVSLEKLLQGDK